MKYVMMVIVLVAMGMNVYALEAVPEGHRINEEYQWAWQQASTLWSPYFKAELKKYHVLLVPGFMATTAVNKGRLMGELQRVLIELGANYQVVQVRQGGTPTVNGELIRKEIQLSPQPVLLITNSKGGIDALSGLVDHPELWPKLRWLSLQAPFAGSPLVDRVKNDDFLRWFMNKALLHVHGQPDALASMAPDARSQFRRDHLEALRLMGQRIPMLSFAAWKNPVRGTIDTVFKSFRDRMLRMGFENDGLVPWRSQVFPGSEYVAVEGLDHITPITNSFLISFDRTRFAKVILYLTLTRIAAGG